MSIADELRKWVRDGKGSLLAIADRIDAEHESACAEAYGNGVMSVPIAVDESAWVELPKDANGEYIHIGDKVTCARSVWEVTGLRLTGAAWGVCCTIFNDHGGSGTNVYPPCDLRHHHAPTVEDVLRDFAQAMSENMDLYTGEAIDADEWRDADARTIAKYAQRLRLAGDAE